MESGTPIDERLAHIEQLPLDERAAALEVLEHELRTALDDASRA